MPSSRFRFKVGRQWGTTEPFEAGGDINRSVFKDNHSGCRMERGGEEESMKAIRWLGPQSCGEWLQPKPRKRLGDGGKGLAPVGEALGGWREGPGPRCFSARGPLGGEQCPPLPSRTSGAPCALGSSNSHCLTRPRTVAGPALALWRVWLGPAGASHCLSPPAFSISLRTMSPSCLLSE